MRFGSLLALVLFAALLVYLVVQENAFTGRASWLRTSTTPEYVHERYQRSYFNATDAQKLRRLHNEEAAVMVGLVLSAVAFAASKRKSQRPE